MDINIVIAESQAERSFCYAVRKQVFVEEQLVPIELELDHFDDVATHYLLYLSGVPSGTARLIDKAGIAKIGRVAIVKAVRGSGLGRLLMEFVISDARRRGFRESVLDAQTYAVPFYEKLGYRTEGDEFDDAGIPHLHMRRTLVEFEE